jgi:hypothetical protein
MTPPSTTPIADIHTPEELLDNAETLLASNNPKMMRAAALEAITALEAYVQSVVFSALKEKLDPLLVQWLEDKTKMDFDSRLSVLTPVAVEHPIDKNSTLWIDYKKAKEIRNKVTHSGRKVSPKDARSVIDTVYKWLAYLGSTVELKLTLIGLKRYIEENAVKITSEQEGISIITDYFGKTKAAVSSQEVGISSGSKKPSIDLILKFGSFTTLVETKFFPKEVSVRQRLFDVVEQIQRYLAVTGITQSAAVIFHKGDVQEEFQKVSKHYVSIRGDILSVIYVVVIKV